MTPWPQSVTAERDTGGTLSAPVLALTISEVLSELGYIGLVLLMIAETVFPPIPSEVVLPLAGYLVQKGDFEFVPTLVASTFGSLVGAVLLEELARHGGRPFAERFLRFARQNPAQLERAEAWFRWRGSVMVLAGRCIPGVRSLIALPAGVLRMPRGGYVVLTLIGSTIWNAALITAGYLLGSQWERVADAIGPLATPIVVVVVIGIAGFLLVRALHRRRAA
jgi:membrane protein DedA with SNARE-associated domain